MFTETKCGCISSPVLGSVRRCAQHRSKPDTEVHADLDNKVVRTYPASGRWVFGWDGGKGVNCEPIRLKPRRAVRRHYA